MKQRKIKYIMIAALLIMAAAVKSLAHPEAADATPAGKAVTYFSTETSSDLYELLLKYNPLEPGKVSKLMLFVSDINTNAPIDSAKLGLSVADDPGIHLSVVQKAPGQYEVVGNFPLKKLYSITVSIAAANGPDLLLLQNIDVGKELPHDDHAEEAITHWYSSNWFFGLIGLLLGLLIMFFATKKRNSKITVAVLLFFCMLPASLYNRAIAHPEAPAKSSGGASTTFLVEKETQFLFKLLTATVEQQNFNESKAVFATVVPSPQGLAVIQSPQTGKIVSLNVNVGQYVNKGQAVATIEQSIDAGTQINIISQKNTVESEYQAAKAQYERLQTIADIAAKKDITEAKARYESALSNKRLFDANTGKNIGSNKVVTLVAPINGVVGTFSYSIGSVISAGQTLFEITNLQKVYAEAQVFVNDMAILKQASKFTASSNAGDSIQFNLKIISSAQNVNEGNQSQKVLFEVINPNGQLKIGEHISVRIYTNDMGRKVVIPSTALIDVNGKPAVFSKDKAEQFTLIFVQTGQTDSRSTVIEKGIEEGEHIVTENIYQMKMIYQNQ